jgi:hypothetical protein
MAKKTKESRIPFPVPGILLTFAAVFLFLALVSYSHTDPASPTMKRWSRSATGWEG